MNIHNHPFLSVIFLLSAIGCDSANIPATDTTSAADPYVSMRSIPPEFLFVDVIFDQQYLIHNKKFLTDDAGLEVQIIDPNPNVNLPVAPGVEYDLATIFWVKLSEDLDYTKIAEGAHTVVWESFDVIPVLNTLDYNYTKDEEDGSYNVHKYSSFLSTPVTVTVQDPSGGRSDMQLRAVDANTQELIQLSNDDNLAYYNSSTVQNEQLPLNSNDWYVYSAERPNSTVCVGGLSPDSISAIQTTMVGRVLLYGRRNEQSFLIRFGSEYVGGSDLIDDLSAVTVDTSPPVTELANDSIKMILVEEGSVGWMNAYKNSLIQGSENNPDCAINLTSPPLINR